MTFSTEQDFVFLNDIEQSYIKFIDGPFEGVTVQINYIAFDEKRNRCILSIDYDIIENPNKIKKDKKLTKRLGEISFQVLEYMLD